MADEQTTQAAPAVAVPAPTAAPSESLLHSLVTSLGIDPEAVKSTAKAILANPTAAAKEIGSEAVNEVEQAVTHPGDAAKETGAGVAAAVTNPSAQATAKARFSQPGAANKAAGALEYLTSGIPIFGGNIAKSEEQAAQGNLLGSFGTLVGTAAPFMTGDVDPEVAAAAKEITQNAVERAREEGAQMLNAKAQAGSTQAGHITFGDLGGKEVQAPGGQADQYVYHATDKSRADAIRQQGIKSPTQKVAMYANSPDEALRSGVTPISGNRADLRVFAVPRADVEAAQVAPDIADNFAAQGAKAGKYLVTDKNFMPSHEVLLDAKGKPTSEVVKMAGGVPESDHPFGLIGESYNSPQSKAQMLGDYLDANVVGSAAKSGPVRDIDLRVDSGYNHQDTQQKMENAGFQYRGSSLVSPEEAKASGKQYAEGWNRAEHFEHPDGTKVDVWHDEPTSAFKKTESPVIAHGNPDEFASAVQNTSGAKLNGKELTVRAERYQRPEQAGEPSIRTGVFYSPEPNSPYSKYYKTGKIGYGGTQRVEGDITFKNPIIAKGASGGKVPERAYDMVNGKGAYEKMRTDVLQAVIQPYGKTGHLPGRVADVLEKYGADPDLADHIVENSKTGNTLPYAVQENIVAHSLRKAGYDGVVGYNKIKGQPRLSEVFHILQDKYPDVGGPLLGIAGLISGYALLHHDKQNDE